MLPNHTQIRACLVKSHFLVTFDYARPELHNETKLQADEHLDWWLKPLGTHEEIMSMNTREAAATSARWASTIQIGENWGRASAELKSQFAQITITSSLTLVTGLRLAVSSQTGILMFVFFRFGQSPGCSNFLWCQNHLTCSLDSGRFWCCPLYLVSLRTCLPPVLPVTCTKKCLY